MPTFASVLAPSADQSETLGCWRPARLLRRTPHVDVLLACPAESRRGQKLDYVIKRLRPDGQHSRAALQALVWEAEAGRSLSHPSLIPVLDAQTRRDPCFLVMPRLEGVGLSTVLREGACAPRRALRATRQIAEALGEMHRQGWRHGDVKLENILLSPNGHATLVDLGLTQPLKVARPQGGTPEYAAPEVHRELSGAGDSHDAASPVDAGQVADAQDADAQNADAQDADSQDADSQAEAQAIAAASDIYSLGLTCCEALLASRLPDLPGEWLAAPPAPPIRWSEVLRRCPPGCGPLLRRMLAPDPLDRPAAAEVVSELVRLEVLSLREL